MKLPALAVLTALQLAVANAEHHRRNHLNRRQDTTTGSSTLSTTTVAQPPTASSSPPAGTPPPPPPPPPATSPPPPPPGTTTSTTSGGVPPPAGTTTSGAVTTPVPGAATTTTSTTPTGPPPLATGTGIPPLEQISSGMPTRPAAFPTSVYNAGAQPPVSGVPPLPTAFVFQANEWPQQDRVPPVDSVEVTAWMRELDGFHIPDLSPTVDGSCGGDPAAAAAAAERGWWTCGGHVRSTDIVNCPDKFTWGVSFDDGPSPYTQYLLNYLDEKDLSATFFVVGSRVIERPALLVEEYMKGHEISVHTWSHRPLTSLTTAQVVAELGWTRKAIKTVLGVTPTTMRPPFGDIDDRVRAISMAMGMVPIMWSRTPAGGVFDTNDWMVADGKVNGTTSFATFETILQNATQMETGFIVLQHDLYETAVDLAVGYTLPHALEYQPRLNLLPIGQCIKKPTADLYLESNTNKTFPYTNSSLGGVDTDGDGEVDVKSGDGGSTSGAIASLDVSAFGGALIAFVGAAFASML
ncbi:hypothetical protein H1R20_g4472, partial [Candolleomyces eurysporus]